MQKVFIDTSYFVAAFDPADNLNSLAVEVMSKLQTAEFYTSELIFMEFLNYFSGYGEETRLKAAAVVENIHRQKITIFPMSSGLFQKARTFYTQRADKAYSLVDCASMILMKQKNIKTCLTSDKHFRQEGFSALLSR